MPTFKENPGGMKPSGYKMKYSNSAFPFKSPMRDEGHGGEKGHVHPELPTSEAHSTSVAPVITPEVGELVDPHTNPEGYGYAKQEGKLKKKEKTLLQKLQEKKDRQKIFQK